MQSTPLRLNLDHPLAPKLAGAFFFNDQFGDIASNAVNPMEPGRLDNAGSNLVWDYIARGPFGDEAVGLRRHSSSEGGGGAGVGLGQLGDDSRMSLAARGGDEYCLMYAGAITYTTFNALYCRGSGNATNPIALGGMVWQCNNPAGNGRIIVDGTDRYSNDGFFQYEEYHNYCIHVGPDVGVRWYRDGALIRNQGGLPAIPSGQVRGVGVNGRDVSEGTSQSNTGIHDYFLAFDYTLTIEDIQALYEDPWQLVEANIPVYAVPVALLSGPAAYAIEGDITGRAIPEAGLDHARNARIAGEVVGRAIPEAGLDHTRNARLAGDVVGRAIPEGLAVYRRNASIAGDVVGRGVPEAGFALTRYDRIAGDVVGRGIPEAGLDFTRNARLAGDVTGRAIPEAGLDFTRNAALAGDVVGRAVPEALFDVNLGNRIAGDVVGRAVPEAGLDFTRNARLAGDVVGRAVPEAGLDFTRNARLAGDVVGRAIPEGLAVYRRNASIAGEVVGRAIPEAGFARTLSRAIAGDVVGRAIPEAVLVFQDFEFPPAPPFAEGLVAVDGEGRGVAVAGNGRGVAVPPRNGRA